VACFQQALLLLALSFSSGRMAGLHSGDNLSKFISLGRHAMLGLFKELTQVTVTLDLLVRKTLREPYLAIFCEPPVPKR